MRIPLLGNASKGISTNTSSQECINFYYEAPALGEGHIGALLPVHGNTTFKSDVGNTGVIRGLLYNPIDNLLYVVSGNTLYEVNSSGTATSRISLATSTGSVQMALNPSINEITIVDGNTGKYFQCGPNTGGTIADADFPATATTVFHLNGYFVVNDPTTPGRFKWSDLNSSTSYTASSFATAQSLDSPIVGAIEHNGVIYNLGDTRGELFYNEGAASSIFTRFEYINVGTCARMSVQKFDNSVAWLSRSAKGELHVVQIGPGYQPQIISTPEINRQLQQLSAVADAIGYTYTLDGHEFYVITFPTGNATFSYDALTKRWHQRSGAFSSGNPTKDKVSAIAFCGAWGGHIVGDINATGRLWAIDESTYTFDGANMERRITGPMVSLENEARFRFSEVQIDIEEGVNTGSETGNDGQLTYSYSKDGGHTFSSGTQLSLGTSRTARLMKRKLGYGRLWIHRIYTDTPNKIVVKGAYGRISGEPKEGFPKLQAQTDNNYQ